MVLTQDEMLCYPSCMTYDRNAYLRDYNKKYNKTVTGFTMRLYRNMKSRVEGIQKAKHHLYKGKELLPRQEFYDWARNNAEFKKLWKAWVNSGYDRKLTPSVNRVDSSRGYILDNMEWVTHSENSRLGGIEQYKKNGMPKPYTKTSRKKANERL